MAWIEVHDDLSDNAKVLRASSLLNLDRDLVVGKLIRLWTWALNHRDSGVLAAMTDADVAEVMRLTDRPDAIPALVQAGLLERTADGLAIHDWDEHVRMLVQLREKRRQEARARVAKFRRGPQEDAAIDTAETTVDEMPSTDGPAGLAAAISPAVVPMAVQPEGGLRPTAGAGAGEANGDARAASASLSAGGGSCNAKTAGFARVTLDACNAVTKPYPTEPNRTEPVPSGRGSAPARGVYRNVPMTDAQMDQLRREFPQDYARLIDHLSEYIAETGKVYPNPLATLRRWAREDAARAAPAPPRKGVSKNVSAQNYHQREYDDQYETMVLYDLSQVGKSP